MTQDELTSALRDIGIGPESAGCEPFTTEEMAVLLLEHFEIWPKP